MKHEHANHGIRHKQSDLLILGSKARKHTAYRGPDFGDIHQIGFCRRGYNGPGRQRFDRESIQAGSCARPARGGDIIYGNLAGNQRMRNGIEPARHSPDDRALVNPLADGVVFTQ